MVVKSAEAQHRTIRLDAVCTYYPAPSEKIGWAAMPSLLEKQANRLLMLCIWSEVFSGIDTASVFMKVFVINRIAVVMDKSKSIKLR